MSIDSKDIVSISDNDWSLVRLSLLLGDPEIKEEKMIVFQDDQFIIQQEQFSQQSQKLFEEILQNAIDNYTKHPTKGYRIDVILQERMFSVKNNGSVFSLKDGDNSDIARVFSVQKTSDQYNVSQREVSSQNGLGAKLVNQCAKVFQIQVCNDNLKYIATWKNNKRNFSEKIGKSKEKFFNVVVELSDRNTEINIEKLNKKVILDFCDFNENMIRKYMIDLQMCYPEIKFTLNEEQIPKFTIQEFLELNNIQDFLIQKYNKLNVCIFNLKNPRSDNLKNSKDQLQPLFKKYTVINGIQTFLQEGKHYDNLWSQLKEQSKVQNVSIGMLFLGIYPNVDYSEQVKTKIISKMTEIKPTKEMVEFVKKIEQEKEVKRDTKINFHQKLTEANNIKKKNSECSLILTEGDSASCLFKSIQRSQTKFFDNYGLFPLKGKILGVDNMEDSINAVDNKEIQSIVQIVGLKNIKYNEDNISSLRYQHILIATDYDVDGYHICGLLISFIFKYWPELIELGFLQRFITPIMIGRDSIQKKDIEFFSLEQFNKHPNKLTNVNYYKGLGSFTKEQAAQIGKKFPTYVKSILPDTEEYGILIKQLFTGKADQRKILIQKYQYADINYSEPEVKVEECMNQVIEYSIESIQRAIPSFIDGLKESQRKIIYWMMKHKVDKIKISQLSGKVSGDLDYHHGETSLQGAAILLAQDFAGTNNCNLLFPDGQFGDRQNPKSYGSPRYIFVKPSKWLEKIYKKEDQLLYTFRKSDNDEQIEPENLYPIIPIQMVNGAKGVATGWSTFMPCYKLESIINYIKQKLSQKTDIKNKITQTLIPYYNNYQGEFDMSKQGQMQCTGSYDYDQQSKTLQIYDVVIDESISSLEQFLKTQEKEYIRNEGILIKNISDDLLGKIYKKFLTSSLSLKNFTFVNGVEIKQYDSIYSFINDWIDMRYKDYEKRKQKVLIEIVKDYIIHYNYCRFLNENVQQYFDKKKFGDLLDQKLQYFTPQSYIDSIPTVSDVIVENDGSIDLYEIIQQLNVKCRQIQSTELSEYNYIKDKSVKFFNNYDKNKLQQIQKQYDDYLKKTIKQIWTEELDDLLVK